jgi:hypothetical protein
VTSRENTFDVKVEPFVGVVQPTIMILPGVADTRAALAGAESAQLAKIAAASVFMVMVFISIPLILVINTV